jgi:WD40 repeat protein
MYRILFLLIFMAGCAVERRHSEYLKEIGPQNVNVTDFHISPTCQFVFSAYKNKISIYKIDDSELVNTIEYPDSVTIQAIALSADSTLLITGSRQGDIYIHHLFLNTMESFKIIEEPITSIAIDTLNELIACGTFNGSVFIMKVNGEVINRQDSHKKLVSTLAFNPNQQILASSGLDGKVFFTYLKDQYYSSYISDRKSPCRSIAFNQAGNSLIAAYDNGKIYKYNIETEISPLPSETKHITGWITDVSFKNDSETFLASSSNGRIKIYLPFGMAYKFKFKQSVKQALFLNKDKYYLYAIVSLEGKGLILLSATNMELK